MGSRDKYDKIFEVAKSGGRHAGTYRQAMSKSLAQLDKSIRSHEKQVIEHRDKINNPEKYAPDWCIMEINEQEGLVRRWEKDLEKNQDEAEIEKRVRKERNLE